MSLANPDRVRFYNDNPWPTTKDGTEMSSEASEKFPTLWVTGKGQWMLTDLSERHLDALMGALEAVGWFPSCPDDRASLQEIEMALFER